MHGGTTILDDAYKPEIEPRPIPRESAWSGRPALALLVRALIFLTPIAASTAVSFGVARAWRRPPGLWPAIGWWLVMLEIGGVTMFAVDRLSRRFLPLSALLRMTLIFPDKAPSRFSVALRTGTTRQLRKRLETVKTEGLGHTEGEAAERLLQLAIALREHDRFTRGHGERVRAFSALIGEELGLDPIEISKLQWAGLIHDVGKLAVPSEILNKPGVLTFEEFEVIKTHPAAGMALVGPLGEWLGEWVLAVGHHHERWDGGGYPNGLAGTEIALAGRIVAVADAFDVMTAVRSYKPSHTPRYAREELVRHAGSQFDPAAVRAFINVSIGRLRAVMWPLSWLAEVPLLGGSVATSAARLIAPALLASTSAVAGGVMANAYVAGANDSPPTVDEIVPPAIPSSTNPATTTPFALVTPEAGTEQPAGEDPAAPAGDLAAPAGDLPGTVVAPPTTAPTAIPTAIPPATAPPTTAAGQPASPIAVPIDPDPTDGQPLVGQVTVPATTTPPTTALVTTLPVTLPTTLPVTLPTTLPVTVAPTTTAPPTPCERLRGGATDLAGTNLVGCDLSNLRLDGVDLTGADLTGADLSGTSLSNFDLDGATLTGANLTSATLTDGSFESGNARSLNAQRLTMSGVDVAGTDLSDSNFTSASLTDVSFEFANLSAVRFNRARMTRAALDDATMTDAVFDLAAMPNTTLARASAVDASFFLTDLRWSVLDEGDFTRAAFVGALLTEATLEAANLSEAELSGTVLLGATGTPINAGGATYLLTVCPTGAVQDWSCWP